MAELAPDLAELMSLKVLDYSREVLVTPKVGIWLLTPDAARRLAVELLLAAGELDGKSDVRGMLEVARARNRTSGSTLPGPGRDGH